VAKIEENETALDCLKRELKEEFSIEIEVNDLLENQFLTIQKEN
jgi:ADP-ribose pyrophosphatase YjhB (NUDIX family)